MNIFILEDDFIQQTRIETIVRKILTKNHWEYRNCEVYGKPSQLLENVTERGGHQLFFLDIEIKNEDKKGLEIALEIREKDPHAVIVFVTTHSEFMPITFQYQVSALDFIDKELPEELFKKRMESAIAYVYNHQNKTMFEDSFVFMGAKAQIQVPFAELLYIETSPIPHKLILYSIRERLEFYGQLSDIIEQEPRLFQCHRSFVVNPYNISSIDKKERIAYLKNGSSCIVSRLKIRSLIALIERLHVKES
ncbi:response regulator transcription factor [Streptococcus gordonii]|uniref:response regulator transcription factor n=1 Tax=Streptococcus gordonii TaxID=1302 RepID=UPI0039C222BC